MKRQKLRTLSWAPQLRKKEAILGSGRSAAQWEDLHRYHGRHFGHGLHLNQVQKLVRNGEIWLYLKLYRYASSKLCVEPEDTSDTSAISALISLIYSLKFGLRYANQITEDYDEVVHFCCVVNPLARPPECMRVTSNTCRRYWPESTIARRYWPELTQLPGDIDQFCITTSSKD